MDKDLLRMVIIAVGALVVLAMVLWGLFSNSSKRKKINFYDDRDPLENIDPGLVVNTDDDDFDIVPINMGDNEAAQVTTRLNSKYVHEAQQNSVNEEDIEQPVQEKEVLPDTQTIVPALLQISLVSRAEQGFTGIQLLEAFEGVGLIYGSVKVFERLDDLNQVDYAVASMADPGIFPGDDWENYTCPGVTFFMQPREVEDAVQVFEEMIATLGQLASVLKADVLDHKQQPLTEQTLQEIKSSLS